MADSTIVYLTNQDTIYVVESVDAVSEIISSLTSEQFIVLNRHIDAYSVTGGSRTRTKPTVINIANIVRYE